MVPLLPRGSDNGDASAPSTSPGTAPRLLCELTGAEVAPKRGSDGNRSGKPPLHRATRQPQPASAGGNCNHSPQALAEQAAVGGWCRGRGTRLVVCSKLAGCTHALQGVRRRSTPRGWGRTGSTHQGDLGEQGQKAVAQGWHPGSCRSRHSFLNLLQP